MLMGFINNHTQELKILGESCILNEKVKIISVRQIHSYKRCKFVIIKDEMELKDI